MIDPEKRYLLARPRGGFNDSLVQLDIVMRYAEKWGRVLVLDMSRSGLQCAFDDVFSVRESFGCEVVVWNPDIGKELDTLKSVLPEPLAGRTSSYPSEFRMDSRPFVDTQTGVILTFDRDVDHPERLLLHDQAGGGMAGIRALRHLTFAPDIANAVAKRLITLGPDYDAIHIRHSDYKSDYQTLLGRAASLFAGRRLLVCTDSALVKAKAEAYLKGKVDVVSIADIPDTGGVPLHLSEDIDRAAANIDLFAEIVAMARAKRFVFTQLAKDGHLGWPFSGFALLAEALRADPETVKGLFAKTDRNLYEELFAAQNERATRGTLKQAVTRRLAALDEYRWNYDARKRARRIRGWVRKGFLSRQREG